MGTATLNPDKENITFFSPNEPTCELFTEHIGCGKSTELLRLKAELEEKDFFVVYFESSQDLELGDVDIADIMQAIACGFIRTVLRVDEYQTLIREYQTLVCLSEPYWDRSCGEY